MDINENSPLTCELYIFLKYNYTYLTSMSEIVSTQHSYLLPTYLYCKISPSQKYTNVQIGTTLRRISPAAGPFTIMAISV
jgi:hypothetical protein